MKPIYELISSIATFAADAIIAVDDSLDIIFFNHGAEAIFGYSAVEVVGTKLDRLLPQRYRHSHGGMVLNFAEGNAGARYMTERGEIAGLRRDGTEFAAEASIIKIETEAGHVFAAILRDISGRKAVERHIRDLVRQNQMLADAVDAATAGICITDPTLPDNPLVFVNPAFSTITGYESHEVIGRNCRFLQGPGTDGKTVARVRRAIDDRTAVSVELLNYRKDGSEFWNQLSIYPVFGRDGDLRYFVGSQTDITQRKKAEEQIAKLAYSDTLTGLPNREQLRMKLEHVLARAEIRNNKVAVCCINIDRFKDINITFGFDFGDRLLIGLAERLGEMFPSAETIARLSGDEFALVLVLPEGQSGGGDLAKRVPAAFAEPIVIGNHSIHIAAGAGVSIYPDHDREVAGLLKKADIALQSAKARGKNTCLYFAEDLESRIKGRLNIAQSLREALDQKAFRLHFQPQFDLASGGIVGAEALVRWQRADGQFVPPATFIPIAEQTGLIIPLGEWVLREACWQNRRWQEKGLPPLRMAVNISAVQFRGLDLAAVVGSVLEETGLDPRCLELEVTEGVVMTDIEGHRRHPETVARARGAALDRRFRDRILVAELPEAVPDRPAQGRSVLRARHDLGPQRRGHRRRGDHAGSQPRPGRHRRGCRDRGSRHDAEVQGM